MRNLHKTMFQFFILFGCNFKAFNVLPKVTIVTSYCSMIFAMGFLHTLHGNLTVPGLLWTSPDNVSSSKAYVPIGLTLSVFTGM